MLVWNYDKLEERKINFTKRQQTEKIFSFCFFFIFACGTRISSSFILNILIGWAAEYCSDVMFLLFSVGK